MHRVARLLMVQQRCRRGAENRCTCYGGGAAIRCRERWGVAGWQAATGSCGDRVKMSVELEDTRDELSVAADAYDATQMAVNIQL